jgi:heptosyltransferase III
VSSVRPAFDLSNARRALVIKLRHHGDVLLASPVLTALKAHAPRLEIDALVYAETAEMLSLHPALSRLHIIDRKTPSRDGPLAALRAELALLGTLRERRYDIVIHLTEHNRGAWLCRLLRPQWSVAPTRGKYNRWYRNSFSTLYTIVRYNRRHTVEAHLDALRQLGIDPSPETRKLVLIPGKDAEAAVAERLTRAGLAAGSFLHVHPGSRWMFKAWPVERMRGLLTRLLERGEQIVLTGAPTQEERAYLQELCAGLTNGVLNLGGQLSLKELAALVANAKLFVGVDSAPMHIAAAMGTPTVALFGPSSVLEWGPWQVPHRVVTQGLSCQPCMRAGCGDSGLSDCLLTLSVERVERAVNELLAQTAKQKANTDRTPHIVSTAQP